MNHIFERLQQLVLLYGLDILAALAIFVAGRWLAKLARAISQKLLAKAKVDETLTSFLTNVAYYAIFIFAIIAALGKLGIQTSSLIALLGAAGLAIGLALQGALSNFSAGVIIVLLRPFKLGDYIRAAGAEGGVEEIQIFTTRIRTLDGRMLIVPNSGLTGSNVDIVATNRNARIDLGYHVSYKDDASKVRAILEDIITSNDKILKDPPHWVGLWSLGECSVEFHLLVYTAWNDYWNVYNYLNVSVKERFQTEGITMPPPYRLLPIYSEKAT